MQGFDVYKGVIKPVGSDKEGPIYLFEDLTVGIYNQVLNNEKFYINWRFKKMNEKVDKASSVITDCTEAMINAVDNMTASEKRLAESTKRVSGSVRDSFDKLAQGLKRIEKAADFDRLERYVILLERAEKAMSGLAELEKSGKLEKIASAIR
jgi:predicted  nucleic acid-binding Zn-ribbon protein